ncbi:MAG: hypothetical protein GKS01_10615 [Alphaproteobacteria bacterium]|nr:hypothetical protein [Alphaproteobacteria bacterium]
MPPCPAMFSTYGWYKMPVVSMVCREIGASTGRTAMIRAITLLALTGLLVTNGALAEGRLQKYQNKANCYVWNPQPQKKETVTWTGRCVASRADGSGTQTWRFWKNGAWKEDSYTGTQRDGKRHGRGVFSGSNGYKYDGEYRNGKRHGRGVFRWGNDSKYDGGWRDNKKHGRGVSSWANGNKYDGEYRNGKQHGRGMFRWGDGTKYDGGWRDGKWHGRGFFTGADGSKYDGEYRHGKWHGRGVYTEKSGGKYVVESKNGKLLRKVRIK